jgi:hypothetical protein
MKRDKLSMKGWAVWLSLAPDERWALRKDHPFRAERDKLIHLLATRGVSRRVIGEICGLSRFTVSAIVKKQEGPLLREMKALREAINRLRKTILEK